MARAREAQKQHWLKIFEGNLDAEYVERVKRIGRAHERIGLEPRWYIAAYALALTELIQISFKHLVAMIRSFVHRCLHLLKLHC